jgi:hypothetical protein
MMNDLRAAVTSDGRDAVRTNLFLAATLWGSDASPFPVRVRNLSPAGAMVEAAALPARGTLIRLLRGRLAIGGEVVWTAERRCGLAFAGSVSVRDWMSPPVNAQ